MTSKAPKKTSAPELSNARIIQRNLVYVTGLGPDIADEALLAQEEYFGQYGQIKKIIITKDKVFNSKVPYEPSYSAYITYASDKEASLAIQTVGEVIREDRIIKASYGTTNYCYFFINDQKCKKSDCPFLHSIAIKHDCFEKDRTKSHKIFFEELQKSAIENLRKYGPDVLDLPNLGDIYELPPLSHGQEKLRNYIEAEYVDNFFSKTQSTNQDDKFIENSNNDSIPMKKAVSLSTPKIISACGWGDEEITTNKKVLTNLFSEPLIGNKSDEKHKLSKDYGLNIEGEDASTKLEEVTKNSSKESSQDSIFELNNDQLQKFSNLDKIIFDRLKKSLGFYHKSNNQKMLKTNSMLTSLRLDSQVDSSSFLEKKDHLSNQLKSYCDLSNKSTLLNKNHGILSDSNSYTTLDDKKLNNSFNSYEDRLGEEYINASSNLKSKSREISNNDFPLHGIKNFGNNNNISNSNDEYMPEDNLFVIYNSSKKYIKSSM